MMETIGEGSGWVWIRKQTDFCPGPLLWQRITMEGSDCEGFRKIR